jgi:hypothetical protein
METQWDVQIKEWCEVLPQIMPTPQEILLHSCNYIIPAGTGFKLVTGSTVALGLGCGSGMIGRSSSLGIVGAKITRNIMVIQNNQLKYEAFLMCYLMTLSTAKITQHQQ